MFLVFTLTETSLARTTYCFEFFLFGLYIMEIWSINYWLHFENVKIQKNCLYWKVFNTDIYKNIFFNSLLFFSYICRSVNCMSWVSKFNYFFLTRTEIEARFIFEGFMYCPLWKVHFQYCDTFFHFFARFVNYSRDCSSHVVSQ